MQSPSEIASQSDVIMICVGRDEDVRDVICGDNGILESVNPGTIVIDHTTTSATLAKEMSQILQETDVIF